MQQAVNGEFFGLAPVGAAQPSTGKAGNRAILFQRLGNGMPGSRVRFPAPDKRATSAGGPSPALELAVETERALCLPPRPGR